MVFSRTEAKPAEDTPFDIRSNESLKPSVLSTMDYYHGADLRPSGIEYPEGYVAPILPSAPVAEAIPEEIIEESPAPNVRDNGLGIMVVDYPEAEPDVLDIQDEDESIPESSSEKVLYKTSIAYKKLAFSGLRRVIRTAKELPAAAAQKLSADVIARLGSLGEKVTLAEHKAARKHLAAAALGGVAIGAALIAARYGHFHIGTSNHETAHQLPFVPAGPSSKSTDHLQTAQSHLNIVQAAKPEVHHEAKHQAAQKVSHYAASRVKYHTESLKFHGDTIWNHMHERVRASYGNNVTAQKLTEITNRWTAKVLSYNHLNWDSARHMSIGQKFKIPF